MRTTNTVLATAAVTNSACVLPVAGVSTSKYVFSSRLIDLRGSPDAWLTSLSPCTTSIYTPLWKCVTVMTLELACDWDSCGWLS